MHTLARSGEDASAALEALADAVGAPGTPGRRPAFGPSDRGGPDDRVAGRRRRGDAAEGAIVADEGNTSGLFVPGATAGARRHDWLTLTGGAIGIGLPLATAPRWGAGGRCCASRPTGARCTRCRRCGRKREGFNVTTVLLSNRSYAIFDIELHRVGAEPAVQRRGGSRT